MFNLILPALCLFYWPL